MTYGPMAQRLRRCLSRRRDGEPCEQFATWADPRQRCLAHGGARGSRQPVCRCRAWPFPHRVGSRPCRWPESADEMGPVVQGRHPRGYMRPERRPWPSSRTPRDERAPSVLPFEDDEIERLRWAISDAIDAETAEPQV
jgi:hypothetical protein